MRATQRRMSGNESGAGQWQRGLWESGEHRRGWIARHQSERFDSSCLRQPDLFRTVVSKENKHQPRL